MKFDLKSRKDYLMGRPVPIAGILAITCIFFSLPVNFAGDSGVYLSYVDYFEGILPLSHWYRVRGWVFPLILWCSKRLFGATAYGLNITFYLIYLLFLFAIARLSGRMQLPGILTEAAVWVLFVFNPIILGYFHFILTEGPAVTLAALTALGFTVLYEKSLMNELKGLILGKNFLLALSCILAYFTKQTLIAIPILIYLFFEFQLIVLGHRRLILRTVCAITAVLVFLSSIVVWYDVTEYDSAKNFSEGQYLTDAVEAGLIYFYRTEDGTAIHLIVGGEVLDSVPTDVSITPMEYFLTCLKSHPWMVMKGYIESYLMVSNFYGNNLTTNVSSSYNAAIMREPSLFHAQENVALAEYPQAYGLNLDLYKEMGGDERLIPYGQYTDDNLVTRTLYNKYTRFSYNCLYTLSLLYAPAAFVLHTILFVGKRKTADNKGHGIQMALAGTVFGYGMAMSVTRLVIDRYLFPVVPFAILVIAMDLKQIVVRTKRMLVRLIMKRQGACIQSAPDGRYDRMLSGYPGGDKRC